MNITLNEIRSRFVDVTTLDSVGHEFIRTTWEVEYHIITDKGELTGYISIGNELLPEYKIILLIKSDLISSLND